MKSYNIYIVALILLISGCTAALWETPTFTERVKGYYVVDEKDLLIINGETYSYMLDISPDFKSVLLTTHKLNFQPTYNNFNIDKNGTISGHLKLFIELPIDDPEESNLLDLGFVRVDEGFSYKANLSGRVYELDGDLQMTLFDENQYITVGVPEGGISKVGKIIITPVAVTADAIAVVSVLSVATVAYYIAMVTN